MSGFGLSKVSGQVFLSYGFRPFFLGAALWASIALGLWIAMLSTGLALPSRFDPLTWHIHEMLFGFVLAAMAGFLLTAIPNWTGRHPVSGALLGLLSGLWLLGRIDTLISAWVPAWLAIAADIAFPFALVSIVAREIIAANSRRNFPMIVPVAVLAIAQLLMDLGSVGFGSLSGYGWRLGLAAILIMISVVGGRIVPTFTRNWLVKRERDRLPPAPGIVDRASLGVLHAALLGWVFYPSAWLTGIALLVGAALNLWRLTRWQAADTRAEPLLLALHVGYGWLVLGVGALGLTVLDSEIPLSAAIHALTVGAVGTMILAVMTRVTRGHTGRELSADRPTSLIYVLVVLAAAARIAAAFVTVARTDWLLAAAVLWMGAFGLFALRYAPLLLRPRGSQ
ncbi:MAG: NnrS family protein [Steroidobacteraceae bacterium]